MFIITTGKICKNVYIFIYVTFLSKNLANNISYITYVDILNSYFIQFIQSSLEYSSKRDGSES